MGGFWAGDFNCSYLWEQLNSVLFFIIENVSENIHHWQSPWEMWGQWTRWIQLGWPRSEALSLWELPCGPYWETIVHFVHSITCLPKSYRVWEYLLLKQFGSNQIKPSPLWRLQSPRAVQSVPNQQTEHYSHMYGLGLERWIIDRTASWKGKGRISQRLWWDRKRKLSRWTLG